MEQIVLPRQLAPHLQNPAHSPRMIPPLLFLQTRTGRKTIPPPGAQGGLRTGMRAMCRPHLHLRQQRLLNLTRNLATANERGVPPSM